MTTFIAILAWETVFLALLTGGSHAAVSISAANMAAAIVYLLAITLGRHRLAKREGSE